MSSSLLQRRNLKTNKSPITNKLQRALKWITPIDDAKPNPDISLPEESILKLALKILSDEDNDAEVSIESVTYKQGREDKEPGGGVKQRVFLNLENNPSQSDWPRHLQSSLLTFNTSRTEKTVRQTSQTQISKTETPSHLSNSFCLNNIFRTPFSPDSTLLLCK